jgi:hypothetical protein
MYDFDKNKKSNFLKNGKLVEKFFSQHLNNPKFSSKSEDLLEHWDVKFDVKGLKKVKRSDDNVNENIHWLEIKGITGELGWVYGESDFFVFELEKYWVVVEKNDLQNFITENIIKEYYTAPEMYKLYRRNGRKDVITLVSSYDLCYISSAIIKKINNNVSK